MWCSVVKKICGCENCFSELLNSIEIMHQMSSWFDSSQWLNIYSFIFWGIRCRRSIHRRIFHEDLVKRERLLVITSQVSVHGGISRKVYRIKGAYIKRVYRGAYRGYISRGPYLPYLGASLDKVLPYALSISLLYLQNRYVHSPPHTNSATQTHWSVTSVF